MLRQMPLTPGSPLGAYEILTLLGAGGMGEAYRARDTKLGRDVALKILPDSFAHDSERLFATNTPDNRIMSASYTVDGESFRAEKPRLWAEARFIARPGPVGIARSFDLHPDGERIALAKVPDIDAAGKLDKVVFIFNFFDELRRMAPANR